MMQSLWCPMYSSMTTSRWVYQVILTPCGVFMRITFLLLQHLRVLEDMSRDFALGEHLLLVGNQGVGKNKIVDRFLYLLNLLREYLQLHRCVVYFITLFLILLAFPFWACFHTFDAGIIFLRTDVFIDVSGFSFVENDLFSLCYQLFFPGK